MLKFEFLLKINYHLWYLFKILRYICTRINEVIYTANFKKRRQLENTAKIKMNAVLKIALEVAEGNQILMNRNEKLTQSILDYTKGESKLFNSLYFSKNGIQYRVSNHELPNRDFMMTDKTDLPKYHKNNIEIIVVNGEIVNTKLNFNN